MSSCPPPKDYSQKVWCFQCGNEYFPDVSECIECGVSTTIQKPPDVTVMGKEGEENLAYDFHEWRGEARSLMESLLNSAKILHTWQGATLVTRVDDEASVDNLINEVDLAFRPSLDFTDELIEYSLEEMTDAEVSTLTRLLEEKEIAFQISEEGDLLVGSRDEAKVEDIFDNLSLPQTFGQGVEDADVPYIMSELIQLCNKLENTTPLTSTDLTEGKKALEVIPKLSLPFGFKASDWEKIVTRANAMANLFLYISVEDEITAELISMAVNLKEALPELL